MRKQQHTMFVIVGLVFGLYPAFLSANNLREAAVQTVEAFCKAEFEGDRSDERTALSKFSPARATKERERDPLFGGSVIFWDVDPSFIVEWYKVLDVTVNKDRAIATVSYKRVARSERKSKIIPDYKDPDLVKLDLVHDGKQWWILDPPLPRISKQALMETYASLLNMMDDKWLERPEISQAQKRYYRERKEALRVLQSLP